MIDADPLRAQSINVNQFAATATAASAAEVPAQVAPAETAVPAQAASPETVAPATPPSGTVRVFWLRPTDVTDDERYPDGIAAVMREAQSFLKQKLGKTFTLNDPVVEVVAGTHDANWYITNNCSGSDHYWCVVANMQQELMQRLDLRSPDQRWLNVGEVSAEEVNQSGGGASTGWVLLSGHDADGAAGVNGPMNRWYGGMVHELGHALGLPDSTYTDGTCMSASFYDYPDCSFSQSQRDGILNGPYAAFLS